jgi:hypothetical protein
MAAEAASQSFCSKPILAELLFDDFVDLVRGILGTDFSKSFSVEKREERLNKN